MFVTTDWGARESDTRSSATGWYWTLWVGATAIAASFCTYKKYSPWYWHWCAAPLYSVSQTILCSSRRQSHARKSRTGPTCGYSLKTQYALERALVSGAFTHFSDGNVDDKNVRWPQRINSSQSKSTVYRICSKSCTNGDETTTNPGLCKKSP